MRKPGFPIKTALVRLLLVAALSACQVTPYQPIAPAGGFGEVELGGNIWRVRFMHNGFTTRETAQSYWLYRAAELTLSRGYDGFEVLSQTSRARSSGDTLNRSSAFFIEGEIRMLKKPFESVPPKTYNAEALRAVLDPYVSAARSEPLPVASKAETLPSSDGLRLKMMYAIPCVESGQVDCQAEAVRPAAKPAAAPIVRLKPAPVIALPKAPPVAGAAEPPLKQTGPCEVKPVMTDQDLVNCGAQLR